MKCPKCNCKKEMDSKAALWNLVINQCAKCKNIEVVAIESGRLDR